MEAYYSTREPAPPGFTFCPLHKRALLTGVVAVYLSELAELEALLPDYPERIHGVVLTPGPHYDRKRLGARLWHIAVPDGWLPYLRPMLDLTLNTLSELDLEHADRVERDLSIERLRSELDLTRQDYNRITLSLQQQVEALTESETRHRELSENLRRSNAELQQFAHIASHDLQEPLRAVAGCVRLLQQRYQDHLDAQANELIQHAVDGALRMQTLIHDLLEFSRVETRGQPFRPVPLRQIVDGARLNLSAAILESGAQIRCEDALPTVYGDETQLTQLMQNLLGNALKYRGAATPDIRISARASGHGVECAVHDNGIGIESTYFERIFVIFQRLHTREEYPGTGVGLAICKKVIERHRGRIWLESTPGQGTSFYFFLPEAPETEQAPA